MAGYSLAVVRHAFAEQGQDPPLSDYGRRQAIQLGRDLSSMERPEAVLVSPARRAMETAALILDTPSAWPPLVVDARLAVAQGDAIVPGLLGRGRRLLLVTHEDVLGAIVSTLTGKTKLGYGRASVTFLAQGPSGAWKADYRPLREP